MDVELREAIASDVPGILAIANDAILHSTANWDEHARWLPQQQDWFAAKQAGGWPVIVVIEGNEVLGYGSYGPFRPWSGYRYSVEHSLYVRGDRRGEGLGKMLLGELIKRATAAGMRTMIAGIDGENTVSIELHRRFGFEVVGRLEQSGYKFGRWLDLVLMQRVLK